jgi:hypothetical protein
VDGLPDEAAPDDSTIRGPATCARLEGPSADALSVVNCAA